LVQWLRLQSPLLLLLPDSTMIKSNCQSRYEFNLTTGSQPIREERVLNNNKKKKKKKRKRKRKKEKIQMKFS